MAKRLIVACAYAIASVRGIQVGDKLPDVTLDKGFPPEAVSTSSLCSNKKIILVGLPGAFTPT
jgi:peroxiredoxin